MSIIVDRTEAGIWRNIMSFFLFLPTIHDSRPSWRSRCETQHSSISLHEIVRNNTSPCATTRKLFCRSASFTRFNATASKHLTVSNFLREFWHFIPGSWDNKLPRHTGRLLSGNLGNSSKLSVLFLWLRGIPAIGFNLYGIYRARAGLSALPGRILLPPQNASVIWWRRGDWDPASGCTSTTSQSFCCTEIGYLWRPAESSKLIVLFQRPVWGYFMCYPAGSSHQKDIFCGHRWDWEGQRQYSGRPDDVQLVLEEIRGDTSNVPAPAARTVFTNMMDPHFLVQILNVAAEIKTTIFCCPVILWAQSKYSPQFPVSADGGGFQCSRLLYSRTCCVCRDGQGAVIRVAILSFQTTRSCPFTFDLCLQGWYFGPKTCLLTVSLSHLTVVCLEMVWWKNQ